jgi:hypothetical protein
MRTLIRTVRTYPYLTVMVGVTSVVAYGLARLMALLETVS